MKILILVYACEPEAGSEYGVGWMTPLTLAKNYPKSHFYVLTRSRCKKKIEQALSELQLPNLHFLFYDIPKWLFYKNEMQSHWGEQINYLTWQLLVRRFVKKQHKVIDFDIIHHLTFNQYRTPSPGFWLDIPFIFGPIGGAETIAPAFWEDLEPHTKKKERIRTKGKDLKLFRWFTKREGNKKVILCSSEENMARLTPYALNCEVRKLTAIAFSINDLQDIPKKEKVIGTKTVFEMLYAGKALDWKGIHFFLKAVKMAFPQKETDDWAIKLVGIRFKDEQEKVMRWVNELSLSKHVTLIPFVQRADLLKMMRECSLHVYPAFRDSGSMSVLEASALGCPTICFDAGGQDVFPDNILLKVPVKKDYESTLEAFANNLRFAFENHNEIKEMGLRSKEWVTQHLTWERKAGEFMEIYKKLLV